MSISILRLAVLIDSDNISYRNVGNVLNKLKNYGEITLKRAYGDFTIHEDCPGSKKRMEGILQPKRHKYDTDIAI